MFELISKGGYVIVAIMACSLVAFTVIIERWLFYRAADASARRFQKFCQDLGAADVADSSSSGVAATIFEKMWESAARLPADAQEQRQLAVDDTVRSEIPRLESNLYILTTAATIAPLLGLLGTVLGMMDVLLAAHRAAPLVQSADLTGGLESALAATALSLIIAVLAYAGYNLLVSRVESILLDMERSASALMNFMRQWRQNRETPRA